ncbi:MAG: metalloregulator ArsR/SmtB family transcription factor [Dethiobacteria bacterium]|jgi:ArsR family transcriptional regulator|nr:metalloregulator ArsR/SmtB family transcription factor [Bacillota bacterium]NMD33900.1 helix-turn-helix transcriptional regulator [Bacillota bacterium]HOB29138.1 metalloregulator ArsR/SmtB family transcription factor [Bacillota bacterium]HPZ41751.1 metalloregulator ArsR/SmtB family transcription factor [Bacillota bacterium]HQD52605.1 metalloregulator ArsR/SmtB family transcription factor [Bacillota bacterium]
MIMNRGKESCDTFCVNPQTVERVKAKMLSPAVAQRLAMTFKVLGEPTRIKILDALSRDELCVCDLAALLEMSSSAVSHQLRVLRDARLVKYRREGKMAFYSLDDAHVLTLFEQGLEHVGHTAGELE